MEPTFLTYPATGRGGLASLGLPYQVTDPAQANMPDFVVYYGTSTSGTHPAKVLNDLVVVDSGNGNIKRIPLASIVKASYKESTTAQAKVVNVKVAAGFAAFGRLDITISRNAKVARPNVDYRYGVYFEPTGSPTATAQVDALLAKINADGGSPVTATRSGSGANSVLILTGKVAGEQFSVETSAGLLRPEEVTPNRISSYRAGNFRSAYPPITTLGADDTKALKAVELLVKVDVPADGTLGNGSSYQATGNSFISCYNNVTVLFDPAGANVPAAFTAIQTVLTNAGIITDTEPRNDEVGYEYAIGRTESDQLAATKAAAIAAYTTSVGANFVSMAFVSRNTSTGINYYTLTSKSGTPPTANTTNSVTDTVAAGEVGLDDNPTP